MTKWRITVLTPSVIGAAFVIAIACRDATAPTNERSADGGGAVFKKEGNPTPACFRLTGGGRVDAHDEATPLSHSGTDKSTPDSRDFATFGFQARPTGCNDITASGHITWVEHNPGAIGGGFTFHGDVTMFMQPFDGSDANQCARFTGTGSIHLRDGTTADNVSFTVAHACDVQEPGVGYDHIYITISYSSGYSRHGLLSGGNIQKHKLTGNGA
jgi:hypothetical protein